MFDHYMDMTSQDTRMCQEAWYQLRNIRSVRRHWGVFVLLWCLALTMVTFLPMTFPKAYCINSQKSQNATARVVAKCLHSNHITPHPRDLHWLPVWSRIKYKSLALYSTINTMIWLFQQHTRNTETEPSPVLLPDYGWTAYIYKNCSSTSTFKQSVKTYLFNRAYCWCLIFDYLERLRTAEKADVWRYIKCFVLLLLLLLYYMFTSWVMSLFNVVFASSHFPTCRLRQET